jgi:hypothetical protein
MTRTLEYLALDELQPAEHNPKRHDLPLLDESFRRFGYVEPIILDERTGRLVVGHGRVDALRRRRAAGEPPPDGVEVDDDDAWRVPVLRGWSSTDDDEADGYLLASNRLVEAGGWDLDMLADLLPAWDERDALGGTGWSMDALHAALGHKPTRFDASPQLEIDYTYRVVIDCDDAEHQGTLLERLRSEGLRARAVAQ